MTRDQAGKWLQTVDVLTDVVAELNHTAIEIRERHGIDSRELRSPCDKACVLRVDPGGMAERITLVPGPTEDSVRPGS